MQSKTAQIAYWAVTLLVALETLIGGIADLMQGRTVLFAGPLVADVVTSLGYPVYILKIIGFWKVLGGVVLLLPGYPKLKDWAYAGIFFELSGAAASWLLYNRNIGAATAPAILAVLVLASWALQPQRSSSDSQ